MVQKKWYERVSAFLLALVMTIFVIPDFDLGKVSAYSVPSGKTLISNAPGITITGLSFKKNNNENINGDTVLNDGDSVKLDFRFDLDDTYYAIDCRTEVYAVDLSQYIKGVQLADTQSPLYSSGEGDGHRYIIENNTLYIEFIGTKFAQNENNKWGSGEFGGEIDLDSADTDGEGKPVIKVGSTSYHFTPYQTKPVLGVNKTAGALTYNSVDGKYYQHFTVTVSNTGDAPANNVVITENPGNAYTGDITNVNAGSAVQSGNDFTLATLAAEASATIEYDMPIDVKGVLNENKNKNNSVSVKSDEITTPVTANADAAITAPSVVKSGTLSADKSTINWTITIDGGSYKKGGQFSISNIRDNSDINGAFNIDPNDDTDDIDIDVAYDSVSGTYTITYSETVPQSAKDAANSTTFSNSVTVDVEGKDYPGSDSVTYTPDGIGGYITKTNSGLNENGEVEWTVTVTNIPSTATSISIVDQASGYQTNGAKAVFDAESFTLSGIGAGKTIAEIGTLTNLNSDAQYNGQSLGNFTLTLNAATVAALAADPTNYLTIKYKDKPVTTSYIERATNTATVNIGFASGNPIPDSDTSSFDAPVTIYKAGDTNDGRYTYDASGKRLPIKWMVETKTTRDLNVGEVITLEDTIPEHYSYIDGSGLIAYGWNGMESVSPVKSGNKITFTVTVTDANKAYFESGKVFNIFYTTEMESDYYNEFILSSTSETVTNPDGSKTTKPKASSETFTNKVVVKANGDFINLTTASVVKSNDPTKLISKGLNGDPETGDAAATFAEYKVVVNEDAADVNVNGDTVTVKDTLGSRLSYVADSVRINGKTAAELTGSESFSVSGKQLTFTLNDATKYTITYKVQINPISTSATFTAEQLTSMFSNNAQLEVGPSTVKSGFMFADGTYKSTSAGGSDNEVESITISGTKTWSDSGFESIRPHKIEINVKRTSTPLIGTGETVDHSYDGTITVDENQNWSYELKNLITKDDEGTTYTYEITEIKLDGYEVTYSVNNTSIDEDITINLTNTFTAPEKEVGKVVITKAWSGGTFDNTNLNNHSIWLTAGDSNTAIYATGYADGVYTFTGLRLYDYSRNADEDLVRTPIEYTIHEAALADYVMSSNVTNDKFKITTATDVTDGSTLPDKEITVTNTYSVNTKNIKVNKAWNDLSTPAATDSKPDGVTAIKVGIYQKKSSDEGYSPVQKDNSDYVLTMNEGNSWTVTFTDLPVKDAADQPIEYTVKELEVTGGAYSLNVSAQEYDGKSITISPSADGLTIKNEFKTTYTSIDITKVWDETHTTGSDSAPVGVNSVTVGIYQDGAAYKPDGVNQYTVTLNSVNSWHAAVDDLPEKKSDGTSYVYTIKELSVEGGSYTFDGTAYTYDGKGIVVDEVTGCLTITNKYTVNAAQIDVAKSWDDTSVDGANNTVPAGVTAVVIGLYNQGTNTKIMKNGGHYTVTLNAGNNWSASFTDLADGSYTVKEESVTGGVYAFDAENQKYAGNDVVVTSVTGGFTVTNKYSTKYTVKLSKKAVNGTSELPDAQLKLFKTDAEGHYNALTDLIDSWTSETNKQKEVQLTAGTYAMVENAAPGGYEKSENVVFSVSDTGVIALVSSTSGEVDGNVVTMRDAETPKFEVSLSKKAVNGSDELPDAHLKLYKADADGSFDENDTPVKSWISTNTAEAFQLTAGTYAMVETTAPDNYAVSENVVFTVSDTGAVALLTGSAGEVDGKIVTMRDEHTYTIKLSKKIVNGSDELPDAKLKIFKTDADGNYNETTDLIESWISTNDEKQFQLVPGTYAMVEITAPFGYEESEDVIFIVADDGTVSLKAGSVGDVDGNTVTMFDALADTYPVTLSKKAVNGTNELPDAVLKIYKTDADGNFDENDTPVDSWISTNTEKEIELTSGTYAMVEITAPDGYAVSENVVFTVSSTGEITLVSTNSGEVDSTEKIVTMRDAPTHPVTLSKKAVNGTNELPNAELKLYKTDADGNFNVNDTPVKAWISTDTAEVIRLVAGTYAMVETTAPYGYAVSENVIFNVSDTGEVTLLTGSAGESNGTVVTMRDAPKTYPITLSKKAVNDTNELPDAVLELYKTDADGSYNTGDAPFKSWTSTNEQKVFQLEAGTYAMVETSAPNGYAVSENVVFNVSSTGAVTLITGSAGEVNGTVVTMRDAPTFTVKLSKKAVNGTNELPGAHLFVYHYSQPLSADDLISDWISGSNAKEFTLTAGDYIMVETQAPEGYDIAESIIFRVSETGVISIIGQNGSVSGDTVTMRDALIPEDTFPVKLSKKAVNGTNELPGAVLKLYKNENGQLGGLVHSWISTTEQITVNLEAGTYSMVETTAPNGYELSENVVFTVSENGTITLAGSSAGTVDGNVVTMLDAPVSKHPVKLSKKAVNGTKELPGASLKLYKNENGQLGELVRSWNSTNEQVTVQLEAGTYTMVEITAPDGYELSENVVFTVSENGTITLAGSSAGIVDGNVVTMLDAPAAKHPVQLSKKAVNGTNELPGASLKLYRTVNGQLGGLVHSWISTTEQITVQLEAGTYTMVETTAPDGYALSENVVFTVDEDGRITLVSSTAGEVNGTVVTMRDEVAKTTVKLSKKAVNGTNELPGARIRLFAVGADNKLSDSPIIEWISGNAPVEIKLSAGRYAMVEITAPNGYLLSENVIFDVDANGRVSLAGNIGSVNGTVVTMFDQSDMLYAPPFGSSNIIILIKPSPDETPDDNPSDNPPEDISATEGIAVENEYSSNDNSVPAAATVILAAMCAAYVTRRRRRQK